MTNVDISVVMPSYNQGRFIREAIDSVLHQDVNFELIVMDGGSDDGTVEILEGYGDAITFTSGPDDGQSWAINEGMRRTSGPIVCWLNSDDLFLPGALRTVLEAFDGDPDLEFVTGNGENIAEDGTLVGDVGARPAQLWEMIHHRNSFNQPSCFMARELWFDVDGLDESLDYIMDWDLWIRCGCAKAAFLPQSLSQNRNYADNKTNSGGRDRLNEIEAMVARFTPVARPRVIELYDIETRINLGEVSSDEERQAMGQEFQQGMHDRLSGVDTRGAFGREFKVSVTPRRAHAPVGMTMSPISRYVPTFKDQIPTSIAWDAGPHGSGRWTLESTAASQHFEFPFVLDLGEVATITATAVGAGFTPVGAAEILGYLDFVGTVPSPKDSEE